jgi:hypothetical protein
MRVPTYFNRILTLTSHTMLFLQIIFLPLQRNGAFLCLLAANASYRLLIILLL